MNKRWEALKKKTFISNSLEGTKRRYTWNLATWILWKPVKYFNSFCFTVTLLDYLSKETQCVGSGKESVKEAISVYCHFSGTYNIDGKGNEADRLFYYPWISLFMFYVCLLQLGPFYFWQFLDDKELEFCSTLLEDVDNVFSLGEEPEECCLFSESYIKEDANTFEGFNDLNHQNSTDDTTAQNMSIGVKNNFDQESGLCVHDDSFSQNDSCELFPTNETNDSLYYQCEDVDKQVNQNLESRSTSIGKFVGFVKQFWSSDSENSKEQETSSSMENSEDRTVDQETLGSEHLSHTNSSTCDETVIYSRQNIEEHNLGVPGENISDVSSLCIDRLFFEEDAEIHPEVFNPPKLSSLKMGEESEEEMKERRDVDSLLVQRFIDVMNRRIIGKQNKRWFLNLLLLEILNPIILAVKVYSMHRFINGRYLYFGLSEHSLPKTGRCTFFNFGPSGTQESRDYYCLLPLNAFFEIFVLTSWYIDVVSTLVLALNLLLRTVQWFLYQSKLYSRLFGPNVNTLDLEWISRLPLYDWLFITYLGKLVTEHIYGVVISRMNPDPEEKKDV